MSFETRRATTAMAVLAMAAFVARSDTVVLKDGSQLPGEVIVLDAEKLQLRDPSGKVIVLPRSRIARVLFDSSSPSLKVELRCASADDEMDLLLNGDPVIERAGPLGTGWTDVTDKVRAGNNELRAVVHNQRISWAYRWELRINGKMSVFSCGQPGVKGKGCSCCGLSGNETGVIDKIDPVWLSVDRSAGTAEVVGR